MIDIFFLGLFSMFWLGIFYSIIHLFYTYIPKGLFLSQILFLFSWISMPRVGFTRLGTLSYDEIPIFWIMATLLLLIKIQEEKKA